MIKTTEYNDVNAVKYYDELKHLYSIAVAHIYKKTMFVCFYLNMYATFSRLMVGTS